MTWLPDTTPEGSALEQVLGLVPDAAARLHDLHRALWDGALVDPALVELVRLRVGQLVGGPDELRVRHRPALDAGLTEEKVAALRSWPTSPLFDAAERAALAFAELYVIDPHAVSDDDCAELLTHLTPAEAAAL